MKSTYSFLLGALVVIMTLPGCNWWGCGCSNTQDQEVQEEVVVVVPEETETLQEQQIKDLPDQDSITVELPDSEK